MRIADILASLVEPDAIVLDLTAPELNVSPYANVTPDQRVRTSRDASELGAARLVVVLQSVGAPNETAPALDFDAGRLASRAIHVVFADALSRYFEQGLVERAAVAGWEVSATHRTQHKLARFAVVLVRPEVADARRLRAVGEYRIARLKVRLSEESEERLQASVQELEARVQKLETRAVSAEKRGEGLANERQRLAGELVEVSDELTAAREALVSTRRELATATQELIQLRATHERVAKAFEETKRVAAAQRVQSDRLEQRLAITTKRLVSARGALSFRIGRATKLVAKDASKNPLKLPERWLAAFRGPDEILADVERAAPIPTPRIEVVASAPEIRFEERQYFLAGSTSPPLDGPLVAGIVTPRAALALGAAARFVSLTPNAWRHLLERESPAYVLVTSDGIAPGTAWGDFGIPGGRGGESVLDEMITWCRARSMPVVFWDMSDRWAPRLGVARGARFDAVFTVSGKRRSLEAAMPDGPPILVLPPAIEPRTHNPAGLSGQLPSHPIFVGRFDRRLERAELAALTAILRAATPRGLEIYDERHGYQGPLAESARFPEGLPAPRGMLPADPAERAVLQRAGIVIAHHGTARSDVPSWSALRALALGVHVVTTPLDLGDAMLNDAILTADSNQAAGLAIDQARERPLLDEAWERAFAHLVTRWSLAARLNAIAAHCRVPEVAHPEATVGVVARIRTSGDLESLRAFVASQTRAPATVEVLVDDDQLEASNAWVQTSEPGRVSVRRASDPASARRFGETKATHLLLWRDGMTRTAVASVGFAARLSDADVLAIDDAPPSGIACRYGRVDADALCGFRRDSVLPHLQVRGADLRETAAYAASGTQAAFIVGARLAQQENGS